MSPATLMNVQQIANRAAIKRSQVCALSDSCCWRWEWAHVVRPVTRQGTDERKQLGPHTLRPISMVQHIKLSFTDKRYSALLLVTLVLQQVVAEWEIASLCLNPHSTYLLSTLAFQCLKIYSVQVDTTYNAVLAGGPEITSRKIHFAAEHWLFFSWFTSRKCKFAPHILVAKLTFYFSFQTGIREEILLTALSRFTQYSGFKLVDMDKK